MGQRLRGSFGAVIGKSVTQFNRLGKTIGEVDAKSRQIKTFRKLKTDLAETGDRLAEGQGEGSGLEPRDAANGQTDQGHAPDVGQSAQIKSISLISNVRHWSSNARADAGLAAS